MDKNVPSYVPLAHTSGFLSLRRTGLPLVAITAPVPLKEREQLR